MSHDPVQVPFPRRRGTAVALAMALAITACQSSYTIDGRLAAEDGALGIQCSMAIHDPRLDIVEDACGIPDSEGLRTASSVPTGEPFRCRVSGDHDVIYELRVRCPGYAPLDVPLPVEACRALFRGCDDIDLGTLTVRR